MLAKRRHMFVYAAVTAMLIAVGLSGSAAQAQTAIDAPPALAAAIEAHIAAQDREFAGDCRDAQTGEFAGQYCYTVVALTAETADVRIGLALSDESEAVSFRNVNGVWQAQTGTATPTTTATATATTTATSTATATATATRTATPATTPSPPKTGNAGLASESNNAMWIGAIALLAAGFVVGGGRLITTRR